MADLTYRELKEYLNQVSEERLDDTVTICLSSIEEYYPITGIAVAEEDVLDEGHLYLQAMDI